MVVHQDYPRIPKIPPQRYTQHPEFHESVDPHLCTVSLSLDPAVGSPTCDEVGCLVPNHLNVSVEKVSLISL